MLAKHTLANFLSLRRHLGNSTPIRQCDPTAHTAWWPNECNRCCLHLRTKKCWTMLKTMFDGNQTSFDIILHHATSCNMVAKRVQHVGFSIVGRCCIKILHPFGRSLYRANERTPENCFSRGDATRPRALLAFARFTITEKNKGPLVVLLS